MRQVFDRQRAAFEADPYPDLEARKAKLRRLVNALRGHQSAIGVAVNADFGVRSGAETRLIEVLGPVLEARHALSHLRRWMRPRRRSTELLFLGNGAWVAYQPKGVVGIIGTWNFPVYMTLGPLIAALAAGNRAMIKASEYSPHTTMLLGSMLAECFSEDEVAVFGGDVAAAQAFNALPFNHLVFTGSPRVGREVMRAAAENLTPVTLELGGKSPAIVGPAADLGDAACASLQRPSMQGRSACHPPARWFPPASPPHLPGPWVLRSPDSTPRWAATWSTPALSPSAMPRGSGRCSRMRESTAPRSCAVATTRAPAGKFPFMW
jgi:coniferyl-aldehyde dehydrogenase